MNPAPGQAIPTATVTGRSRRPVTVACSGRSERYRVAVSCRTERSGSRCPHPAPPSGGTGKQGTSLWQAVCRRVPRRPGTVHPHTAPSTTTAYIGGRSTVGLDRPPRCYAGSAAPGKPAPTDHGQHLRGFLTQVVGARPGSGPTGVNSRRRIRAGREDPGSRGPRQRRCQAAQSNTARTESGPNGANSRRRIRGEREDPGPPGPRRVAARLAFQHPKRMCRRRESRALKHETRQGRNPAPPKAAQLNTALRCERIMAVPGVRCRPPSLMFVTATSRRQKAGIRDNQSGRGYDIRYRWSQPQ